MIEGDTQTAYLLALTFDLLPEALRERRRERLVENSSAQRFHLTTGFVGVGLPVPGAERDGYGDVAYRLLRNETYPSLGLLDQPRRDHDLGALGRLDRPTASRPRR